MVRQLWLAFGLAVLVVAAPAHAAVSRPAPSAARGARITQRKPPRHGPVELFTINHKEKLVLRLRDAKGKPVRGLQKRFDRFLRCHHTKKQHKMSPRLARLLYETGRHWPGRRLEIVSGYRHPTVAKNPHSPHMQGVACDFRVAGVKNSELRDYLRRTFDKVGVGYYPNSSFVHLDVRKDKSAFWIDYSGPGERSVYSTAPSEDLRTGRADAYRPSKIPDSFIEDAPAEPDDAAPPGGAGEGGGGQGGDRAPVKTSKAGGVQPSAGDE